jgi:hypothetical protein
MHHCGTQTQNANHRDDNLHGMGRILIDKLWIMQSFVLSTNLCLISLSHRAEVLEPQTVGDKTRGYINLAGTMTLGCRQSQPPAPESPITRLWWISCFLPQLICPNADRNETILSQPLSSQLSIAELQREYKGGGKEKDKKER